MQSTSPPVCVRFGPFVLDMRSGDLSRNGRSIRLQEKSRCILLALAERPSELITRTELHERLWPGDTFVDFEDGLNAAMSKLREALGDDIQSPRYIETVRGRGYRFLATVRSVAPKAGKNGTAESNGYALAGLGALEAAEPAIPAAGEPAHPEGVAPPAAAAVSHRVARLWFFVFGCITAAAAIGAWYWLVHRERWLSLGTQHQVLLADFDNQTGDPRFDHALDTALTVSLGQSRSLNVYSRLQMSHALRLMARPENDKVTAVVGREICQRENIPGMVAPGITRAGNEYLLTAQLIDPATGAAVRSYWERAAGEKQILPALDSMAASIRRGLGESRLEIRQSSRPLPEVTTASLAALEAYSEGADKFTHDQASEAIRLYEAALADDPGFAMAHAALGTVYYSFLINEPALGEQEFRKALALDSRTTDRERLWIALRYAEGQGRIADALALYQDYLRQYPGDWAARFSYARQLRMHRNPQESLPIYEQLVRVSPNDAPVYIEMATAEKTLGLWPQAIAAYEKAFALDPSMLTAGNVNREYGFTLVSNGETAKAEQIFSALLANPQTYTNGERSLAFLHLDEGRYASARQELDLALAKSNDPFSQARIRYMLAVIAAGEGNRSERIAELDRIVAGFGVLSQKVQYGALVGQAYARAGEVDKAKNLLAVISPLINTRAEEQVAYAQLLRAEISAATGDFQGALGFLKPPEPYEKNSTAVLTRESLAYVYQRMGNLDQAINWNTQFLQDGNSGALGWEPQQQVFEVLYDQARDFRQKNAAQSAMIPVNSLLALWKNADADLPLLKEAKALRTQLIASR
jgi:eukaryotic-like serine/threonine-protein kinase